MLTVLGAPDATPVEPPASGRVIHAVRCPAPAGLPMPAEISTCNAFLAAEVKAMPKLRGVVALGALAHHAVLVACGVTAGRFRFSRGRIHQLPDGLLLADGEPTRREPMDAVVLALIQRITG